MKIGKSMIYKIVLWFCFSFHHDCLADELISGTKTGNTDRQEPMMRFTKIKRFKCFVEYVPLADYYGKDFSGYFDDFKVQSDSPISHSTRIPSRNLHVKRIDEFSESMMPLTMPLPKPIHVPTPDNPDVINKVYNDSFWRSKLCRQGKDPNCPALKPPDFHGNRFRSPRNFALTPETCQQMIAIAKALHVSSPKQWLKKNCVGKLFFSNANCEEFAKIIDSCFSISYS
uniref:Uncharacterized protein n=1 Tax=Panagrolaimus sp. JU765 TaxID=591449 RepID=A0AC34QYY5_9BILA